MKRTKMPLNTLDGAAAVTLLSVSYTHLVLFTKWKQAVSWESRKQGLQKQSPMKERECGMTVFQILKNQKAKYFREQLFTLLKTQ